MNQVRHGGESPAKWCDFFCKHTGASVCPYKSPVKPLATTSDDGAAAPHAGGVGGASCDPSAGSADSCACRSGGAWAQGGWGARVGLARKLPPQRGAARVHAGATITHLRNC